MDMSKKIEDKGLNKVNGGHFSEHRMNYVCGKNNYTCEGPGCPSYSEWTWSKHGRDFGKRVWDCKESEAQKK